MLRHLPHELLNSHPAHDITSADSFAKVLGVEWNATLDVLRPIISPCKSVGSLMKQLLMSEITRIFDVMGWRSPMIIKPKIMLQDSWKAKADWDQPVSQAIHNVWQKWSEERPLLQDHLIPCNYYP